MSREPHPIRVAIVAQFFPPEGGAPSARLRFMANSLLAAGMEVKVITAMPSYPEGRTHPEYQGKLYMHETRDGMDIYRSWAYVRPKRSTLNRVLNYFTFSLTSVLWLGVLRHVDIIVFSQGPMFAGAVGFLAKKLYAKPVILDVRDLWPDRIWEAGVLTKSAARVARLLGVFERFMYRNSAAVVGVTHGLCDILNRRVPNGIPIHLIRNSAQVVTRLPAPNNRSKARGEPIMIVESGTQGLYQDPATLARAFAVLRERRRTNVELRFYGDGPRVPELLEEIKDIPGAEYLGHQSSDELLPILLRADIGVVTLQSSNLNKVAVSRRMFDYALAGLAIVYCGEGEGATIVNELGAGVVVPPTNVSELASCLEQLITDPVRLRQLKCSSQRLLVGEFSDQVLASKWIAIVKAHC